MYDIVVDSKVIIRLDIWECLCSAARIFEEACLKKTCLHLFEIFFLSVYVNQSKIAVQTADFRLQNIDRRRSTKIRWILTPNLTPYKNRPKRSQGICVF